MSKAMRKYFWAFVKLIIINTALLISLIVSFFLPFYDEKTIFNYLSVGLSNCNIVVLSFFVCNIVSTYFCFNSMFEGELKGMRISMRKALIFFLIGTFCCTFFGIMGNAKTSSCFFIPLLLAVVLYFLFMILDNYEEEEEQ
ncbi:MAG: hypothetical protein IJ506_03340 [Clostridia bacterium]|nr:hypothetical protein [Clostridia bacterium]